MSDLNFDLNMSNYTIIELENLLKISSPYNFKQIQSQGILLKKQIFKITLNREKKLEISIFIKEIIETLERNFIVQKLNQISIKQDKLEENISKILNILMMKN